MPATKRRPAARKATARKVAPKQTSSDPEEGVMIVDFTGIEAEQGRRPQYDVIPQCFHPDLYKMKIVVAAEGISSAGNPKVTVDLEVVDGYYTGNVVQRIFAMVPDPERNFGLRNLKAFLEALTGKTMRDGKNKLRFDRLIGKLVAVEVEDTTIPAWESYEERPKSNPFGFYPVSEYQGPPTEPGEEDEEEGEGEPVAEGEESEEAEETAESPGTIDDPFD